MNELLYKKIENCIRDKMCHLNNMIRSQEKGDPETIATLTMLIIVLCADISSGIKDILEEDIEIC